MTAALGKRERISAGDLAGIDRFNPLQGVASLTGVRVYDVGQGDSIALLDGDRRPVLQIDYGGRQGNPFQAKTPDEIDGYLPVAADRLVMLTHWDEDHWCSAAKARAVKEARWLVPRQITSPRAVRFSTTLDKVSCIPESRAGEVFRFRTSAGDEVWWEKIAPSPIDDAKAEDCNRTGVALSVVKRRSDGGGQVILISGDAPFHAVRHYAEHCAAGLELAGLVAFHHGAGTHWTRGTRKLLRLWPRARSPVEVAFSCADPNAFNHPFVSNYLDELGGDIQECRTAKLRGRSNGTCFDISFK